MQQELIAEIHRTFARPVVVAVDVNCSNIYKLDMRDIEHDYAILIVDLKF
jgi:hypothetical protein